MSAKRKDDIVTFKVDHALWEALQAIPNRSAFIRSAILTALDSACPLCQGSGTLTPDQRRHWERFAQGHALERCDECEAFHLVCVAQDREAQDREALDREKGHDREPDEREQN